MTSDAGTGPRTVEELQAALAAYGRRADAVARDDDPQARRDEDAVLVKRLPDGRVEVVIRGRGVDRKRITFPDEAAAVAWVAADLLAPPLPIVEVRTEEQRRIDSQRARERAREELRRLEELGRQQDGDR